MSQKKLHIGIAGLKLSDALALRSIVRLSKGKLERDCIFTRQDEADVIIGVSGDMEFNRKVIESKQNGRTICIALTKHNEALSFSGNLLQRPIRPQDVVNLLNSCDKRLSKSQDHDAAVVEIPDKFKKAAAEKPQEEPSKDLKTRNALALAYELQKQTDLKKAQDLLLSLSGEPQIHIRLPDGKFSTCNGKVITPNDGTSLLESLAWMQQKIDVEKRAPEAEQENDQWLPMDCFYWHLGVHALSDELLPGLDESMLFKLKRWPDFGRNGADSAHLKLAAFMVRRALSLAELKTLTRQPSKTIIAFINACALCNLLLPKDRTGHEVALDLNKMKMAGDSGQGLAGVFSAIRSVFGMRA